MKTKLLLLGLLFALQSLYSNTIDDFTTTVIPDANFETYLETHDAAGNVVPVGDANSLGDGTDGNNLVTTSQINVVTKLYLSFLNIEDLTGLEGFIALEDFQFLGNNPNVATLNLPALTNLKKLYLGNFPNLASVNVSSLLNVEDATFQSLSALSSLDLSLNTSLVNLRVNGSAMLSNLNFVSLSSLEDISLVDSSIITALDFTTLTAIKKIHIQGFSALTSVNLIGLNNLEEFSASRLNNITALDLSTNVGLKNLNLFENTSLASLTIKSGNTAGVDYVQLLRNSLLTCVEVDAGIPINGLATWNQNNGPIFNEDCGNPATYVPDDNFEAFLEANAMGNGIANDDKVTTANINTITVLDISNKSISDLTGIEDFTALVEFNASSNTIATVNISENLNLEKLILNSNLLTEIDVKENLALVDLLIKDNSIKVLDVSKNSTLDWLDCSGNLIETLDLSENSALSNFIVNDNNLSVLNMLNGGYSVRSFDARNNSNLTCIQVFSPNAFWDANYSVQIDSQTSFNTNCNYPETNVPDANFENYLETHDRDGNQVTIGHVNSMGNGIANDNKVYTHRINTVTTLNVSGLNISDFTGVEDFRDLELFNLFGGNNVLVSIDLSQNIKLKRISLSFVSTLTNVTLGNLPEVTWLQLGFTNISTIDISGLPKLDRFVSQRDKLTSLDTSGNPVLKTLGLSSNSISNLDISASIMLESLSVGGNQLTSLDVSNNPNLKSLSLFNNQIKHLDLSNNSNLISLNAANNQIKHLDLSNNSNLISLNAANNQLESLNLNNGSNNLIITNGLNITGNLNLTCAEVSDVPYANANWTAKDSQTMFNTDCSSVWSVMTNSATTTALLAIPNLDANNDGKITQAEAAAFTGDANGELNLSGTGITDVEGLAAFTSILKLDVSGNGITDLSPLTGSSFGIVSKSTGRTKRVQKTTAMALQTLIASNNNFDVLDVSSLSNLTTIDISNNANLITLNMQNGNNASITSFTATNAPNLSCILVDDVNASYLSTWVKDTKSEFVASEADCRAKVLSIDSFDVSNSIYMYPNPVNDVLKIDVSNNLEIKTIEILNVLGKRILKTTNLEIRFVDYSKGIYLLKIGTNKGVVTKKVIKN